MSDDYGFTWKNSSSPSADWYALSSDSSRKNLVAVVNTGNLIAGPIYYSLNSGQNWTKSNAPTMLWCSVATDGSGQNAAATVFMVVYIPLLTSERRGHLSPHCQIYLIYSGIPPLSHPQDCIGTLEVIKTFTMD